MRASNRSHWQHNDNVEFHLKFAATLSNQWGPPPMSNSRHYKILASSSYIDGDYEFVSLRKEDLTLIKHWRNRQVDVLRQKVQLTDEDQERYYNTVVVPTFDLDKPRILLISILCQGLCVGYGGLANIDWESARAEVSTLIDPERHGSREQYREDILALLGIVRKLAFEELKLHRLYTETYDIRPFHICVLEEFGFVMEGRLKDHNIINNQYVDSIFHGLIYA